MSEITVQNKKKGASFFKWIAAVFKSKRSRDILFAFFLVFATLSMFFIDTQNAIRDKEGGILNFLTNNFVADFFIAIGIGRYDVTASAWTLFGCILAVILVIFLGNIIAPKFVDNKVAKNSGLFASEKKIRIFYTIVFYFALVLIAGVIILISYFLGAFKWFGSNTVEESPFISLLIMLGFFLGFVFAIILAVFIIYVILRAIVGIIILMFKGKKKVAQSAPEAEVVAEPVKAETAATKAPVTETEEPAKPVKEEVIVVEEKPAKAAPAKPAKPAAAKAPAPVREKTMRKVVVKSFRAKMHQATKEQVAYYGDVKNYLLSYRRVNSRTSWSYDSFNIGRKKAVKLAFRGKTLVAYLALDPAAYKGTKYYPHDVGSKKKYAETPMMVKVKSERGVKFLKELIDVICKDLGKKKVFVPEQYKFPRMSEKKLIEEGLAKQTYVNL